jgi:hypothetical protein
VGGETPIEGGRHEAAMRYTRGRETVAAVAASWLDFFDSAWPAAGLFQTSLALVVRTIDQPI